MLQATFKVSGAELTAELLDKIRSLLPSDSENFVITIAIREQESPETARLRIDRSIENIERNQNLVTFSPEEYETLVRQLSRR